MPTEMDAASLFARTPLASDDALYVLVHLPPRAIVAAAGVLAEIAKPFSALVADRDEVTLVLPAEDWPFFEYRLPDHRLGDSYRLITFDLPLDLGVTGFMALISRVLAGAGVPIMAVSAFERDHVLVPADQFQTAWDALRAEQTRLAGA